MPYDPSDQSVRAGILADIRTTLAAMQPPAFSAKLRTILEFNAAPLMEGAKVASPACVITPGDEQVDEAGSIGRVDFFLEVELLLGVSGKDWRDQVERLMADCAYALRSTSRRGERAVWTNELTRRVFDLGSDQTTGMGRMLFQVYYRTLRDDPTQPA